MHQRWSAETYGELDLVHFKHFWKQNTNQTQNKKNQIYN